MVWKTCIVGMHFLAMLLPDHAQCGTHFEYMLLCTWGQQDHEMCVLALEVGVLRKCSIAALCSSLSSNSSFQSR